MELGMTIEEWFKDKQIKKQNITKGLEVVALLSVTGRQGKHQK